MSLKTSLTLILLLSSTILCRSTVLFETLKRTIEEKKGDTMDEIQKAALESRIKESIVRASDLLNLENFESEECEPDYTGFCPENWTHLGDGIHCKADPDYDGPCEKVMDLSNKTPLDKLRLSRECSFKWQCKLNKTGDVPDNVTQCPRFWLHSGNTCIPHYSYRGLCGEMTLEELEKNKEELTQRCNLEWDTPLNIASLIDTGENCPLGYMGGDSCTPVDGFNPKFKGPLRFESKEDKLIKTDLYNLSWNFKEFNQEYLDEKCPYQWKWDQESSLCLAPASYKGPCQLRVDFGKFSRKVKNIWSVVCMVDFYPNEKGEEKEEFLADKLYKDGAIESELKIVKKRKKNEKDSKIEIMRKQLNELYKLRKTATDDNFLSTLQFTIDKLERKIRAPSFLQISSNIKSKKYECPYNWDQYDNVCVAPKTYEIFVPNCYTIISRFTNKSKDTCRLQFNNDHLDNEDFVREPCPMGWKYERKLDGRILRTICRPKIGETSYKHTQCGSNVDFTNISPNFKQNWAFVCNVKFPPKTNQSETKCKENFYRKCPYGWKEDTEGCLAPNSYFGPCQKLVKYKEIATAEAKRSFSQRCLAFWDCLDNCEKDYTNVCPKEWKHEKNRCIATYKYDFPCKGEFQVPAIWNELSKQEFEFNCKAYWPCKA